MNNGTEKYLSNSTDILILVQLCLIDYVSILIILHRLIEILRMGYIYLIFIAIIAGNKKKN